MNKEMIINGKAIGPGHPTYIVAEMSANHNQDFSQAVELIKAAKLAGADAVKLQTYTPDTLTIDCDAKYFRIQGESPWSGETLYELYQRAYTPWEWQPRLKDEAEKIGLTLFSTPFDIAAVQFLSKIDMPAYKVASFELVDIPLIEYIAQQGKPIILSTGMGTLSEISEAVHIIQKNKNLQLALLKCTSSYPALPEEMHLRTIPHLSETFNVPVGLSDHTLDTAVPAAAVAIGACIIEKHFTLSRRSKGPDSAFSLEPHEFKEMVNVVRKIEKAIGSIFYGAGEHEADNRIFRRSLFVVQDVKAGEKLTTENVRSIRPAHGLHTRYLSEVVGRYAVRDIKRGTPLAWDLVGDTKTP